MRKLILFFVAVYATGLAAFAGISGNWSGTTSQGKAITFAVDGAGAAISTMTYTTTSCGTSTATTTNIPITNNSFSTDLGGICPRTIVSGNFSSSTTASGTLALTYTAIPFVCGCSGSANVTWTATGGTAPVNQPPSVLITAPTTGSTFSTASAAINLSGTASDDAGVSSVTWSSSRGGSGTATGTTSWSIPSIALQTGSNVITVTATDGAGATGTATLTVTYTAPANQPPTVAITSPTTGSAFTTGTATIALGGTAADDASVSSVSWSSSRGGSGTATGTTSWSIPSIALQTGSNVITVTATDGVGATGTATLTVTYTATGPTMSLDRTSLFFSAVSNGAAFTSKTGTQAVRMTQTGAGTVTWTASSVSPWLVVSPASGSGSATLNISVQFVPGLLASQPGTITLSFTGAGNTAGPVNVTLNTLSSAAAAAPVGSFDTPATGTTGIAGSVPVTGWALDDVGVTRIRILRDPVAPEPAGAPLFIGDGVFIDGARPDVQAGFPTSPLNTRAGWGYLMLTNFLPNRGNGPVVLYAYADDAEGHSTLLGTKTITCDNANSIAPFGAIDTPTQGQTIGGVFLNAGWALSPGNRFADVPDGGIVSVLVDGVSLGTPVGWAARSDITALFPVAQYAGVNRAVAGFGLDTTAMTNGVHQLAWIVTATSGGTSGIGSRFFTVSNGSLVLDPAAAGSVSPGNVMASRATLDLPTAAALRVASRPALTAEIDAAPADRSVLQGRRGFDLDAPLVPYAVAGGRVLVQSEEIDRVELQLSSGGRHQYTGYLRTVAGVAPLPIGSTLDPATGAFAWQPGVGFVGTYDLVFVRWSGGRPVARQEVRVVLNPKGSNRVGPQTVIDLPAVASAEAGLPAQAGRDGEPVVVGQPFFLAGWAADLDSTVDGGVDTVHVWAYRVRAAGWDAPRFLGAAVYGGPRPDVAAIYGERFRNSGYGLGVDGLESGTYDLAVFAYSTVRGGFVPAKLVRVTVR